MIVHKIDVTTGNFIEDCQFENRPILEDGNFDPQYVEGAPPQGLYLPRWTGTEWAEGGTIPEPSEPEETIDEKLAEMAEQILIAQEALDFLIMGGI